MTVPLRVESGPLYHVIPPPVPTRPSPAPDPRGPTSAVKRLRALPQLSRENPRLDTILIIRVYLRDRVSKRVR